MRRTPYVKKWLLCYLVLTLNFVSFKKLIVGDQVAKLANVQRANTMIVFQITLLNWLKTNRLSLVKYYYSTNYFSFKGACSDPQPHPPHLFFKHNWEILVVWGKSVKNPLGNWKTWFPSFYKTIIYMILFSIITVKRNLQGFVTIDDNIGLKSDHISGSLKKFPFSKMSEQAPLTTWTYRIHRTSNHHSHQILSLSPDISCL